MELVETFLLSMGFVGHNITDAEYFVYRIEFDEEHDVMIYAEVEDGKTVYRLSTDMTGGRIDRYYGSMKLPNIRTLEQVKLLIMAIKGTLGASYNDYGERASHCPFDQSHNVLVASWPCQEEERCEEYDWQVNCQTCGAAGPIGHSREEAIAGWNAGNREMVLKDLE